MATSAAAPKKKGPPQLRLDKSVFVQAPAPTKRTSPLRLIDSHVHLWSKDEFKRGTFLFSDDRTLPGQAELALYSQLTTAAVGAEWKGTQWAGWVYLQAEAKHDDEDLDGSSGGWDDALREIEDVCKQALATPQPTLLAIVPWAPVHLGRQALQLFLSRLLALPSLVALAGTAPPRSLIKSFRYLLQDSPTGTCLTPRFIDGLKWLGEEGFAFDITVDVIERSAVVLEEALECITLVHKDQKTEEKTRFIFDHLSKPDLKTPSTTPLSAAHEAYINAYYHLALLPHVSLKFSGLLDYCPPDLVAAAFTEFQANPSTADKDATIPRTPGSIGAGEGRRETESHFKVLKRRIVTLLEPLLEAFGDSRIVIGSDWPMFRKSVLRQPDAQPLASEAQCWSFQLHLYRLCLVDLGLEGEALDRVFADNALSFYRISTLQ